jgi:nicotinate (nicotinamide) nucleotide adenylyltransferase
MKTTMTKYKSLEPEWLFFGGTFDPLHVGHMDAVRIARSRFPDAEIVIVPSFAPPVSRDESKNVQATFPDRVAMCVVAFDEWERVQVSSLEEDLEAPSFTVKTLRDLRGEYPAAPLAWMIGADQLAEFTKWLDPKVILELASLVVIPRQGQAKGDLIDQAGQVATTLGFKVSIDRDEGVILLDGAHPIFVLNEAPTAASSRDIREKISSTGLASVTELIHEHVATYIEDVELYR